MKKWLKWLLGILGSIFLIVVCLIGYGYYTIKHRYKPGKNVFTHQANYIDPSSALLNNDFKVCDEEYIMDYYNTDSFKYKYEKNGLRNFVLSKYDSIKFSDSGYLNIRFIVNCEGKAGRYTIHENDLDLNPKKFNQDLVEHLFEVTAQLQDWEPTIFKEQKRDSYMYISYRIVDGKIVEILP